MRKIHRIHLTAEERAGLEDYCKRGTSAPKDIKARSLLLADESPGAPALKDPAIIAATGIASATLGRLRERACEVGPLEEFRERCRLAVERRNAEGRHTVWRFTNHDARIKLRHLYPSIQGG